MVFPVHFLKAYSSSTFLSQSYYCHHNSNLDNLSYGNSLYPFLYETDQEVLNSGLVFILENPSYIKLSLLFRERRFFFILVRQGLDRRLEGLHLVHRLQV